MSSDFGIGDWLPSVISAVGTIGGGATSALSSGSSSDGFSQKGYGQWLAAQGQSIPYLADLEAAASGMKMGQVARYARKWGKKYGFSPLTLLGVPPMPSSPGIPIAGEPSYGSGSDYGIGKAMRELGQDISEHYKSQEDPYQQELKEIDIMWRRQQYENLKLEGQILEKDLYGPRKPNSPQPLAPDGTVLPPGTAYDPKPQMHGGQPGTEPGDSPMSQWFQGENGTYFKAMSDRFADATEEDIMAKARYWTDMLMSEVAPYPPPTHVKLKPGYMWSWKGTKGYSQVKLPDLTKGSLPRTKKSKTLLRKRRETGPYWFN
jgi:hypothetical protein